MKNTDKNYTYHNSTVIKKSLNDLDGRYKEDIFRLLKSYFTNPSALLEREFAHNTHIYIVLYRGKMVAFFMVSWEENQLMFPDEKVVYLGLTCADAAFRNRNFISKAFLSFTIEATEYEKVNSKKIILYGTTATPAILLILPKIWAMIFPQKFGQ